MQRNPVRIFCWNFSNGFMKFTNQIIGCLLLALIASIVSLQLGCATSHYQFGVANPPPTTTISFSDSSLSEVERNPIVSGGDHPTVDKLERVVQAPRQFFRKVLGKRKPTPAEIEQAREQALALSESYLVANNLSDVLIDVRRYEPAEQWARLKANDEIAPVWKYTGGTLNHIRYTLMPLRAFQRDAYDPFTNTLHLNSTQPTDAIYHAAEAKQYRQQRFLGPYAVAQRIPLFPIPLSIAAASDAISYAKATGQTELESELYPATYSRIGAISVVEVASLGVIPGTSFIEFQLLRLAGRGVGKTTGDAVARQRSELKSPSPTENEW
jgi:hypothetical protein